MTLSKAEISVLCSGLEILFLENKTYLTEKGVKKLAKIYCKLVGEVLPVNPIDILDTTTERMLNKIDYQQK